MIFDHHPIEANILWVAFSRLSKSVNVFDREIGSILDIASVLMGWAITEAHGLGQDESIKLFEDYFVHFFNYELKFSKGS